jgi:hypothetical protein
MRDFRIRVRMYLKCQQRRYWMSLQHQNKENLKEKSKFKKKNNYRYLKVL